MDKPIKRKKWKVKGGKALRAVIASEAWQSHPLRSLFPAHDSRITGFLLFTIHRSLFTALILVWTSIEYRGTRSE